MLALLPAMLEAETYQPDMVVVVDDPEADHLQALQEKLHVISAPELLEQEYLVVDYDLSPADLEPVLVISHPQDSQMYNKRYVRRNWRKLMKSGKDPPADITFGQRA